MNDEKKEEPFVGYLRVEEVRLLCHILSAPKLTLFAFSKLIAAQSRPNECVRARRVVPVADLPNLQPRPLAPAASSRPGLPQHANHRVYRVCASGD